MQTLTLHRVSALCASRPRHTARSTPGVPRLRTRFHGKAVHLVRATPPSTSQDDDDEIGMNLRPQRPSLVSDNWEGDTYRGSNVNILTIILGLTFLVPVLGLLFAWLSYGTLWSSTGTYGRLYF